MLCRWTNFCCVTFLSNCRVAKIGIVAIQSVQFRHDDFACITVVVDNGGVAVCVVVIITCNHISFVTVETLFGYSCQVLFRFWFFAFQLTENNFSFAVQVAVIVGCYDSCKSMFLLITVSGHVGQFGCAAVAEWEIFAQELYVFSHSLRHNISGLFGVCVKYTWRLVGLGCVSCYVLLNGNGSY